MRAPKMFFLRGEHNTNLLLSFFSTNFCLIRFWDVYFDFRRLFLPLGFILTDCNEQQSFSQPPGEFLQQFSDYYEITYKYSFKIKKNKI